MNSELLHRIAKSTAHTQNRIENGNFIIQNLNLLEELIHFSFKTDDKLHIRACCILEKVFDLQLDLSFNYLDFICGNLYKLKNDSAIRSHVSELLCYWFKNILKKIIYLIIR